MIEKDKFTNYKLQEEKDNEKSIVLPVRINIEEQAMIKVVKGLLNIHSDSKALKISARVGLNVLQQTFSAKSLKYICAEKRDRLSNYESFINTK